MFDPIRELKTRAEVLHHAVIEKREGALARLRVLPELKRASDEEVTRFAESIQRKHALAAVAIAAGFSGWEHARRVLDGEDEPDFGALLYPKRGGGLNHWFVDYDEAAAQRARLGGYLLAYKRHFFVAEDVLFVEDLGIDPGDPDLDAIGRDFVRPRDVEARKRLYAKILAAHPRLA